MQVTDEALERIAQALRDRDVTIAYLQQRLTGAPATPVIPAAPLAPAATGPDPVLSDFPTVSAPADPATRELGPGELSPQQLGPQEPGFEEPGLEPGPTGSGS
jgi:hypothetical protein